MVHQVALKSVLQQIVLCGFQKCIEQYTNTSKRNFEITMLKGFFVSPDFRWVHVEAMVYRKDFGCENFVQITHSF